MSNLRVKITDYYRPLKVQGYGEDIYKGPG